MACEKWTPLAVRAAQAFAPLFGMTEEQPISFIQAWQRVSAGWVAHLQELGLRAPRVEVEQPLSAPSVIRRLPGNAVSSIARALLRSA